MPTFLRIILSLFLLVALSGCYNTPVRHLASDVVLIDVGTSTRSDVLIYLGEPDDQVISGNGVERWLYRDEVKTLLEETPWVGGYVGSAEDVQVVVVLKDDLVTECIFSDRDPDDLAWQDDFKWQKSEDFAEIDEETTEEIE